MSDYYRPMQRGNPLPKEYGPMIAYDFETTTIPFEGGIEPRYLCVYGDGIVREFALTSYADVAAAFGILWDDLPHRARLVGWNSNRFDARIVMEALTYHARGYTLRPFVAKMGGLRACAISKKDKTIFLCDGMAMLGLQCKLKEFLHAFAPAYEKLELDFEHEEFDAKNPAHVEYARRDAEGLYHGMRAADRIVRGVARVPLRLTIGSVGIAAFEQRLPKGVQLLGVPKDVQEAISDYAFRGGYVYVRSYRGPLWTYDINQAYASAMRECWLPCGKLIHTQEEVKNLPGIYRVVLERFPLAQAPYVVATLPRGARVDCFGDPTETYLCSNEIAMMRRHGWTVTVLHGWHWTERFRVRHFINALERLRSQHPDKNDPMNIVPKSIGNNCYGKTVERETHVSYVFSEEQPSQSARPMPVDEGTYDDRIWEIREERDGRRRYHRPYIGAFITAHVRCQLYDAIMTDPEHFVKADTDSVAFSRPNPALFVHRTKYGAWKLESDGLSHVVIAKKVYWNESHIVAKGLHTRKLDRRQMMLWADGEIPQQEQSQLQGWKKSLAPSWKRRSRKGTRI